MRKRSATLTHLVPGVFVFILIGFFAVASLLLTVIGLRVYRHVTDSASFNSESQMILSYISNKIRTFDATGSVVIGQRDGIALLSLRETLDAQPYETNIYAYDGAIWESFAAVGDTFDPENGERLVTAQALRCTLLYPDLVEVTVELPNGETRTMRMALRAQGAGEAS